MRIRSFAYQLLVLTLPRTRSSVYCNRTGSSTYQRLRSVLCAYQFLCIPSTYISAPLLLCVSSVLHTRCVLASVFAYCLNCFAYQLFVLTFLHIKSCAYRLFCVSAPLRISSSAYRLRISTSTLYCICTVYVPTPLRISSSAYQLLYISAPP